MTTTPDGTEPPSPIDAAAGGDITIPDATSSSSAEPPMTPTPDARPASGLRPLVLALVAGGVAALMLVGGVWWFLASRSTNRTSDASFTPDQLLSALGCANPSISASAGIGVGYSCSGGTFDEVFIFASKQAETAWLLRIQGQPTEGRYVIAGPGWEVDTEDSNLAANALALGGTQVS